MKFLRRALLILGIALLGTYTVACGFLYSAQAEMLYPAPKKATVPTWKNAQTLSIPGENGSTVHAVYLPAAPGNRTVVHFHGNGETIAHEDFLAVPFNDEGLGFLGVEYPGYGLDAKEWPPNENKLYGAAESALQHLTGELGVPRESVVLSGWSLGSGVAVEMARRGWGTKLVLVSAYTSIPDAAKAMFPIMPVGLLAKDRYESLRKAPDIHIPTLCVHGTKDDVIPFELGEALAKKLPNARFVPVEGAKHNDVYREPVIREILSFLKAP